MSKRKKMTPEEIGSAGLEALCRELGPAGMARFLQQFESGDGDYTAERDAWVGHSTVAELAEKIRERREEQTTTSDEGKVAGEQDEPSREGVV